MVHPFFTVIITLTERLSYLLPFTLDSLILQQGNASFEVIIVNGTKEVSLQHLPLDCVTILTAVSSNGSAMLNQALAVAKGHYIHCMKPGEFYISKKALAFATKIIH